MTRFLTRTIALLFAVSLLMSTSVAGVALASSQTDLTIESKSALLMEFESGDVLFAKLEKERLPVASMVKMMTILIALEEVDAGNVSLDTKITTTENASSMGGSQVFLDPYQDYTFEQLFKSVVMASANDASVALAEYFNGNEKAFVNRMNKKAKQLGMNDTHYANCTGLPAPEQYSCAYDCAILLREVLKHDLYHNYSTIWMDTLLHPTGRETELVNTNRLIRYYEGCDGGKTGSTNEAGCCLSASAKRNDMRLIAVVVGAPNSKTRFNENATMFNYGFANYESKKLVDANVELAKIKVSKGKEDAVSVYGAENFSAVVRKGDNSNYQVQTQIEPVVKAPTKAGEKVGQIVVSKDGNIVKTIAIVVKNDVKALSWFETMDKILQKW